jgi:hypothetical protein
MTELQPRFSLLPINAIALGGRSSETPSNLPFPNTSLLHLTADGEADVEEVHNELKKARLALIGFGKKTTG